jgi:ATP-dependent RNA helicase RhlE
MTLFSGLDLIEPIQRAVAQEGYDAPTPIQAQSIPYLLAGRDILGIAQTGTGKTAAFALPLLQKMAESGRRASPKAPRALLLAPTRELAGQIGDCLRTYGRHLKLRSTVVVGGVPIGRQIRTLSGPVDMLVATPGRLIDLMNQRAVRLDKVEMFVLDEADRMLDLGFVNDVRKIAGKLPEDHQTALFSATMPKAVQSLAESLLNDPAKVEVAPQATTAERIDQRVLFVPKPKKNALLTELLQDDEITRVLVFARTKHGADRVVRHLEREGVRAAAIHGNKTQAARQRALMDFRKGRVRALVATDIAARGIDVDGVSHVINFDLPNDPESYVHRIGRTARGGADGRALSFCDAEERVLLKNIERTIRRPIEVNEDHAYHSAEIAAAPARSGPGRKPGGGPRKKNFRPKGGRNHRGSNKPARVA